jgi:hypothetical protein
MRPLIARTSPRSTRSRGYRRANGTSLRRHRHGDPIESEESGRETVSADEGRRP